MNELSQWAIALSVAAVGLGIDHVLRRLDSRRLPWFSTRILLNGIVLVFLVVGTATAANLSLKALHTGWTYQAWFNRWVPSIVVFVFFPMAVLLLRDLTSKRPVALHNKNHSHYEKRWYRYELSHESAGDFHLHFVKANWLTPKKHRSDVSLKAHPAMVLPKVMSMLKPGQRLHLATPNPGLQVLLNAQVQLVSQLYPNTLIVPVAHRMSWIHGQFGNLLHGWGLPWGRPVEAVGYKITLL